MLVLWQNHGGGFVDEEVEVRRGADRLCPAKIAETAGFWLNR
jgi:hypothetical protein